MEKVEFATMVILVGMSIVFIALIGLTLIFMLYGKIVSSIINKKKDEPKPPAPKKKISKSAASAVPAVEHGIGDDVIAAISAAVAYMMGEGSGGFTVKSIRRAPQSRKAWSMAGIMQNTRPF